MNIGVFYSAASRDILRIAESAPGITSGAVHVRCSVTSAGTGTTGPVVQAYTSTNMRSTVALVNAKFQLDGRIIERD
ncbi:unnamed protein product [Toxocara canis]|uniref:Lipoprotein n=1 Tax=Toxocara canis TaxID=6265 RepID=A0A183UIP0_TOXCA|nr:unnamed protein product [Toxocara canis]